MQKKTRAELLLELPYLIKRSGDFQIDKTVGTPGLYDIVQDIIDSLMVSQAGIPIGGIISWSGFITDIPQYWVLCNGRNGTPNLMDRFIIGSGSNYSVSQTDGSKTHSHTGTVGAHILLKSEMPIHDHGTSIPYDYVGSNTDMTSLTDNSNGDKRYLDGPRTTSIGGGQGHSHPLTSTSNGDSMPPYYALAFIMYKGLGWDPSTQLTITITSIDSNKDLHFTITNGTITNGLNVQYSTNGVNWSSSAGGGVGSPKNVASWNPINGSFFRLQSLDDVNVYSNDFQYIIPNYSSGYSSDYAH